MGKLDVSTIYCVYSVLFAKIAQYIDFLPLFDIIIVVEKRRQWGLTSG
mgnify:CR=1 FL=1